MHDLHPAAAATLSVVVPCFNERTTLAPCIERLLAIRDPALCLDIIIVDDGSTDGSSAAAEALCTRHSEVRLARHPRNMGKGAALRTGFAKARGEYVAVQDADLEYDPRDLKRLLEPLRDGSADVVFGSRFLSYGAHRVLYFWHSLGNAFLTTISNVFTDLNLTDMETCYKVFRRDIIQSIDIEEDRFGVEPEIVAKVAHLRPRIYELGVSYHGRTYAEGKKIGARDGLRALYAILKYNAHKAPLPVQFLLYLFIGGIAALANLGVFLALYGAGYPVSAAAPIAFAGAAVLNYLLCVLVLFRHKARWSTPGELLAYIAVVAGVGALDLGVTEAALAAGAGPGAAKSLAILGCLALNFAGRKYFVFYEPPRGPWAPSRPDNVQRDSRGPDPRDFTGDPIQDAGKKKPRRGTPRH
jgi:glycosyltransferase involved in cell wall biosynthesis